MTCKYDGMMPTSHCQRSLKPTITIRQHMINCSGQFAQHLLFVAIQQSLALSLTMDSSEHSISTNHQICPFWCKYFKQKPGSSLRSPSIVESLRFAIVMLFWKMNLTWDSYQKVDIVRLLDAEGGAWGSRDNIQLKYPCLRHICPVWQTVDSTLFKKRYTKHILNTKNTWGHHHIKIFG